VLDYYVDFKKVFSGTPYVLASALKRRISTNKKIHQGRSFVGFKLKLKDEYIDVPGAITTDSEIFDIFTIPLINVALQIRICLMIRILLYFHMIWQIRFSPHQSPVGQEIIGLVNNVEHVFIVKGVFENIPENSTLRAQCFLNSKWTLEDINKTFGILMQIKTGHKTSGLPGFFSQKTAIRKLLKINSGHLRSKTSVKSLCTSTPFKN
jgi:hypothetical protein